ncbi:MAG: FadR/GntR family transcriptional regulator [Actinomycetota bacterium]
MSRNLTTTLVEELRARIIGGQISPGERLPSESTLIAEHGVSRTVVREAVARLQAEGLVHTRRGSGSYVLTPPSDPSSAGAAARPVRTLEDRRRLLAYRIAVESEAAALAAAARTSRHLAALGAALDGFERDGRNPSAALARDFEFHRGVAEASGNPYFVDALTGLGPTMISMPRYRLERGSTDAGGPRLTPVAAEHRAVLDAITAGDPLAASAAMRTHLSNSRRRGEVRAGA